MSDYADYVRERLGDEIIENECGFATYRFIEGGFCYIVDIYIKPEFRKTYNATTLADEITKIAKFKGCHTLLGSIVPTANSSTASLKVLLGYGMTLQSSQQNLIYFKKEI